MTDTPPPPKKTTPIWVLLGVPSILLLIGLVLVAVNGGKF